MFIDYIDQQQNPKRIPHILAVWEAARKGLVTIYTSIASIVEVIYFLEEKASGTMNPDSEERIDALWYGGQVILSEVSPLVARDARAIIRRSIQDNQKVRPVDALHLSTAQRLGVSSLHTYDEPLFKYAPYIGMPIEPPSADAPFLVAPDGTTPDWSG